MASYIGRRKFLATLGGAAAWPLAAHAQQSGKLPTIGFLGQSTPVVETQRIDAFLKRLRELGWIEGRTRCDRVCVGARKQRALRRDRG
jgi:hypothetical protein